jgi:hypothetical protein
MAQQDLIYGAGTVAQAKGSKQLAQSKAATGVAAFLAEGIGKVVQKRNKEFNEIMKTQLSKEGLTDEEYNELYKKLKRRRGAYVYLNKKERMDFERETLKEAEEYKKNEADREEIADDLTDEDNQIDPKDIDNGTIEDIVTGDIKPTKDDKGRVGYSLNSAALQEFVLEDEKGNPRIASYKEAWNDDRFTVSKDGKFKTDKFGNKYENTPEGFAEFQRNSKLYWIREAKKSGEKVLHVDSQTGKREYLDPDEAEALLADEKKFVTMDEIKNHVKSKAVDKSAVDMINASITGGSESAKNLKLGDSMSFDYDAAKLKYEKIINSTDPYKLATQNIVGGTSFKQDLLEKLESMDYKQLGISDELVKKLDPTNDGKVSADDARIITNKLMSNEDGLKAMLKGYFTLYEAREFNSNIPKEYKGPQSEMQNVTNDDLETGSVNEDGIYVPN